MVHLGTCDICKFIVMDPKECVKCGGIFCFECIKKVYDKNLPCPKNCDDSKAKVKFQPVSEIVNQALMCSKFKCN